MEGAQIKEELYHFIESGDTRLIKMLHAVAKEYTNEAFDLIESQKKRIREENG